VNGNNKKAPSEIKKRMKIDNKIKSKKFFMDKKSEDNQGNMMKIQDGKFN
jgi:hypothetical protein